jgi:hypothetical protein
MKLKQQLLLAVGVLLTILGMGFIMVIGIEVEVTQLTNPNTRLTYTLLAILLSFVGGYLVGGSIWYREGED